MKQPFHPLKLQLNLPLVDVPSVELPEHKQRDLALALVDLLVNAALAKLDQPRSGGSDESETE